MSRMYIKSDRKRGGEKSRKESFKGKESDNRTTTTAMPDHIVTLCLITLRDVRSSMKLVQHVYCNNHHYRTHTHTHRCISWKMLFQENGALNTAKMRSQHRLVSQLEKVQL